MPSHSGCCLHRRCGVLKPFVPVLIGTRAHCIYGPDDRLDSLQLRRRQSALDWLKPGRQVTRRIRWERTVSLANELKSKMSLPVMGAPMFIVSVPALVIEQCSSGIIGSFPALNARPAEMLETWLVQIENSLEAHGRAQPGCKIAPYAVNQIIHHSNDRL